MVCLIERVGEEGIDCVVLRELLLEDEHIIHVREYAVEVRGKKGRFNFVPHLGVARLVHQLD